MFSHVSVMKTIAMSLMVETLGELLARERTNCSVGSGRISSSIVRHTHWSEPFIEPGGKVRSADRERKSMAPGTARSKTHYCLQMDLNNTTVINLINTNIV